jgi:hypothetical protein
VTAFSIRLGIEGRGHRRQWDEWLATLTAFVQPPPSVLSNDYLMHMDHRNLLAIGYFILATLTRREVRLVVGGQGLEGNGE